MTTSPSDQTPFDWINSILDTKIDLMETGRTDYPAFFVNKALSMYPDTLYHAYVLNLYSELPDAVQYRYLLNTVQSRDRRRYKWPKPVEDKNLEIIQKIYRYNRQRAAEALSILTKEELRDLVVYYRKHFEPRSRYTQKARNLQSDSGDADENR